MDNNNNKNTEREKSIEELFCDMYEEADSNPIYDHARSGYNRSNSMRMAKYKKNKVQRTILMIFVIAVLVAMWLVAAVSIVRYVNDDGAPVDTDAIPSDSNSAEQTNDDLTTPDTEAQQPTPVGYIDVKMAKDAYKYGDLILINSTYTYDQSKDTTLKKQLVSVWEYARQNLVVSQMADMLRMDTVGAMNEMFAAFKAETGLSGYCLRPDYAYCTREDQQKWYDACVVKYSNNASAYEFKGGESEHETGRAFDLKVEVNNAGVHIRNADSAYLWIYDNCYKYGIIYRYPATKVEITGVSMAATSTHADHFRYVGKAAAAAMHDNDWCLEQLIAEMSKYTFDGDHLAVTGADGTKYEMYSYPANPDGETNVKVPEGSDYSISGNNIDGFIITITLK